MTQVTMVCRSCGESQAVALDAAGESIVCVLCEHETSAGDASLRSAIVRHQRHLRSLTRLSALLISVAGFLVALRVTWIEARHADSALATIVWLLAALFAAGSLVGLVRVEQQREVIYF